MFPIQTAPIAVAYNDKTGPWAFPYLLSALRDPYKPTRCANSLIAAIIQLPGIEQLTHIHDLTKHHELWTTLFMFLVAKRTDEQLDEMLRNLSKCSCLGTGPVDEVTAFFHALWGQVHDQYDMRLLWESAPKTYPPQTLNLFLGLFTNFITSLHRSHGKSMSKGVSKRWPSRVEDILPLGSDSLVESFLQWYRILANPIVFEATTSVLRICKSLVRASLIKYRFTRLLVDTTRRCVDRTLEKLEECKRLEAPLPELGFVEFSEQVKAFVVFLDELSRLQPAIAQYQIMDGCETKCLQLCTFICYLLHYMHDDLPDVTELHIGNVAMMGQQLFRFYHMHLYTPRRPDIPVYLMIAMLDRKLFQQRETLEQRVGHGLVTIRYAQRCSRYGCNKYFQQVGDSFQRCAGCRFVSYCGKDCQVKDWKDKRYPHKRVCRLLSVIGRANSAFAEQNPDGGDGDTISWNTLPKVVEFVAQSHFLERPDFLFIDGWVKRLTEVRTPLDRWNPGYDDFDAMMERLCGKKNGLVDMEPEYMNRLVRSPEEIRAERVLLAVQPFWQEDIDL